MIGVVNNANRYIIQSQLAFSAGFYTFSNAVTTDTANGTTLSAQASGTTATFAIDGSDVICSIVNGVNVAMGPQTPTMDLPTCSSVSSQLISGSLLSCSTAYSSTGRKVSSDAVGNLYAVFLCGSTIYSTTFLNGGSSWSAPVSTGFTSGAVEYAVQGGPSGVVYLTVIVGTTGYVAVSYNSGTVWSAAVALGTTSIGIGGVFDLSISSYGNYVYVLLGLGSSLNLYVNNNKGSGSWTVTSVSITYAFFDVIVDNANGDVYITVDNPQFNIFVSTNNGASFGPAVLPSGSNSFTDWAGGNGNIYVIGSGVGINYLSQIPLSDITSSTNVNGLAVGGGNPLTRAISADSLGNAYIATETSSGGVALDRFLYGNPGTVDSANSFTIASVGSYPGVVALPCLNGALVLYTTASSQVFAAVHTY